MKGQNKFKIIRVQSSGGMSERGVRKGVAASNDFRLEKI